MLSATRIFHWLCQKDEDTCICIGCIENAGIFHFEIMLEGMVHSKKCRANVTIFREAKKMYRLVSTSLSTRALGAFGKCKVVSRTRLVREKETKQEVSIAIWMGWRWNWCEKINSCERSARSRWTTSWGWIWKIQKVWAPGQANEGILEPWSCLNGWKKSQMDCKEIVLHIFNKCF